MLLPGEVAVVLVGRYRYVDSHVPESPSRPARQGGECQEAESCEGGGGYDNTGSTATGKEGRGDGTTWGSAPHFLRGDASCGHGLGGHGCVQRHTRSELLVRHGIIKLLLKETEPALQEVGSGGLAVDVTHRIPDLTIILLPTDAVDVNDSMHADSHSSSDNNFASDSTAEAEEQAVLPVTFWHVWTLSGSPFSVGLSLTTSKSLPTGQGLQAASMLSSDQGLGPKARRASWHSAGLTLALQRAASSKSSWSSNCLTSVRQMSAEFPEGVSPRASASLPVRRASVHATAAAMEDMARRGDRNPPR
eukprot:CAMPEP_0180792854 /NCGR_PEP_ID=MMETSP1038_2-20121128/54656_1 /TAXON_ID=632150 /ORGANISM="Azadinium spinosum, Strain 3D9" /LENGTH=304 /DNA_ID=CAMNT_0022831271 /DNA_START=107 /DNA_END=1022 /DNA_ORIENTATION=+